MRYCGMCSSEAVVRSLQLPVLVRLQAEAGRPFDVLQGPLVRALLVKLGSSDHLFLLTMHHAVCDGWSFKVSISSSSYLYPLLLGYQMVSCISIICELTILYFGCPCFSCWPMLGCVPR